MMLKKLFLVILCLIAVPAVINAQGKAPKKPSKIWYQPVKTETKEVKLEAQNAVSEKEITKFKWTITNNTKDFIIVRPKECMFKAGEVEIIPNDKKKINVRPLDSESKVIDGINTAENSVYEFNMSFISAGMYRSRDGVVEELPDFSIPASQNVIEEGDFKVELISANIQSDVQWRVKLKITYRGEGVGIVEPRKISARAKTGTVVANNNSEKIFALERGEEENIICIFSTTQPVWILWNDAFKTAQLEKMEPIKLDFEYDPTRK